ncbi:C2H2-type zinc finger protein [Oceanobacillus saliphilus]|uniref:C2H2-type zinc finger protein n=1 Tax=Oceanobacillus saliphilus TaxID=2925834 RepID=UPI0034D6CD57
MPSNAQKKHKCKVCDKRFTRPSSLQTHMYSHTGEKRKFYFLIELELYEGY